VPTRTLLKAVWGHQDLSARNVLRVTASRLRAKLQADPASPPMLQTVAGEGLLIRTDRAPASPPAAEEPYVDADVYRELQELMAGTGDHPLRQLNDVFSKFAARHMQSMRDALASGDAVALGNDAHRVRGNSASLGARRMSKVAAVIEERSRAGDLESVPALLVRLEEELDGYQTAIAPMLD
jgi:HPt (histidine-containing phosphotransfer) domain-containing protein